MSGPYRPGYPGNGGTPFSPGSQTNQPVSFKTDINRKKTKKWVAAKSYSYDGDDWGDDDDDEEDEEDEEEVPRVTDTSRFAPTSQQTTSNPAVSANTIAETPSTTQAPGFVRPADIYRRIQEEKESDSKPHEFARSSTAPAEGSGASFAPAPSVAQDSSQNVPPQQLEGDNARSPSPLVIPEVKRLSGFGQDFFGGVNQPEQAAQFTHGSQAQGADQGSSLQHNPSLGFTSVVHQAFDVEETPNSSTGSFSRSNSGGTSLISPIISPWKSETDKTPTIAEDPTAEASAQEPPANFKPGHRRDMSLPSPGNGPDRVPTVINADEGHSAEVVQSSSQDSHTSSESPVTRDQDRSGEATPRPSSAVHESLDRSKLEPTPAENAIEPSSEDGHSRVPSPLQIPNEQPQHIPQVAPSFGTDESPHDMESDRLRKEIMRSFSSDHISDVPPVAQSQSIESEEPKSRPEHESTYLPSEYDSYWGQQGIPPTNPLQVRSATSPAEPATLVITPQTRVNTTASESGPISAVSKSRPKLKKKFSWEESEDSEEDVLEEAPVSVPSGQPMQPLPVVAPVSDTTDSIPPPLPSQSAFEMHSEALSDIGNRSSLPGYPADEKEVTGNFEKQTEEPQNNFQYIAPIQEPEPEPSTLSEIDSHILPPQTQPSPSPVNEASLPTFRKIMQISSPSEKIKVFNDTREQFAQIDTGLSDWIRRSSESLPEHADLIQANGRLPGGAPVSGLPPRAKFPKLSSLGNLSLPSGSSHGPDGSSSTSAPGHARRSSGSHITGVINRSNVESKGKDFLHSAGALGGKAGGAARGLFAKGKSKLRGADKGMSSIFRGQRRQSWGMGTGSDAQSSDLEFDHQETTNFSVSSRYSLQPVPRIPSLRLGDGKSFRDSFDGDEGFSMHARSFSADFGRSLRSVTEGEAIAFNPERISSLRRTVMSFDSDADESSMAGKSSVLQDRLSVTTASHGDDGNLEESLGHVDSVSVSTGSYETKNRDTAFEGKPKDGVVGESGSLHGAAGLVSKDDFSSVHDVGHDAQSSALGPRQIAPPLTISPEMSPPFEHGSSQLHSQVLGSSENNDLLDTTTTQPQLVINPTTQPRVDPVSSTDEILRSPVSPPLPQNANLVPPESANRRDSIVSQISEISQDEMDRIREKFDEDGIYADPSPTRSQVSDLTEDDDDDVDDALREKLDEAGFHSDLDKDAWEQFPRPPTAASSNQPIRVVRMTRFTINKKTAQSSENDTNRHSRFSFEGEGNTLAEAMLVNGHGRRSRQADYANRDARLEESRIPVTLGEDAPDKTPPPFPDPEAPYRDDRKEQQAQEGVPANNGRVTDPRNRQSLRSEGAKSPPGYRPIQSLPPAHRDALWKTGRLDNLHTHRDSIASSSVSSISNPNVNPNAPRMAVSPEPPLTGSRGQQRSSAEFRGPKKSNSPRIADVTTTDRSGWSLWANHGRYQQTRQNTSNGAGMSPPSHSNGSPGRHDEESLHSGDSTAVQAAASHQDLRTEPSPLMNSSETASNHSSHARMSTQFLSKVKFMGKRAKGTPAVTSVPPVEPVETKVVEKRKEKKTDGKKGALSRFGGIFNRSGPSQRTEETAQPVRYPQVNENTSDSGGRLSYQQTTGNQRFNTAGTSSSRHTSMPAPDKALPPPPAGYYAPSSKPVYEPPANYANQAYPQYDNASMNAYQPAPAQYAPNIGQYAYQSSPPFQPQPVRQPQQQQPPPPQHHTSIASRSYKNISPTINSRGSNASPELEQPRSRAQDLRMRSRSPRPAQMRTTTSGSENVNYSDPIYNLGKFHAVTETARIGDQSLPFPITLPDDLTNGQLSPRSSIQPEPAIFFNRNRAAAAAAGQQNATGLGLNQAMSQMAIASSVAGSVPTGTTNNNNHHHPAMNFNSEMYETRPVHAKNTIPIELPVPSENDEEEIVMSSTAYPGQEWQPPGFEQWMPY